MVTRSQIWMDGLTCAAGHPWTRLPLAGALLTALTGLTLQLQTQAPAMQYIWILAGPLAAIGSGNILRILNHTHDYLRGRIPRPSYITPTEEQRAYEARLAQPDGIREVQQPRGQRYVCHGCWKVCDRALELKKTSANGRVSFRTFGMHQECQNTPEAHADIAVANLFAQNTGGRMTPPGVIEDAMEQARREFQGRDAQ